jgi:hypothetical protein
MIKDKVRIILEELPESVAFVGAAKTRTVGEILKHYFRQKDCQGARKPLLSEVQNPFRLHK